jgi:hypothetical protein
MEYYKKIYGEIIYSFEYEKLVKNPPIEIPKLIDWLGWKWDEDYLSPQKNERNVFTASSAQVRNKINSKGIGRWKNYEDILKPAFDRIKKSNLFADI